jgi:hypothetical protein
LHWGFAKREPGLLAFRAFQADWTIFPRINGLLSSTQTRKPAMMRRNHSIPMGKPLHAHQHTPILTQV